MRLATIVLAAGAGTRMKSELPKVLHEIAGKPMLAHVLDGCAELGSERRLVVIGHKYESVLPILSEDIGTVHQHEQLGTGHAVLVTDSLMADFDGAVVVLAGDIPLIKGETLRGLVEKFKTEDPAAVMITAELDEPFGYGRVVRDGKGAVKSVVEEKDASEEEREIKEINSGIYCFDKRRLFGALEALKAENHQSEYYLTDVIGILRAQGEKVLAHEAADFDEVMGVNSRVELARADEIMQKRLRSRFMRDGVTFILPETTYLNVDVEIGSDSIILPNCFLENGTRIGRRARIGPNTRIIDSTVGDETEVQYAVLRECRLETGAKIGPYCSIRPGTKMGESSKAGTFVEIKKSQIGAKSKVPHLSYIGDAQIGDGVNVGAGSITCNYDGIRKHKTVIEDDAFIGSDTMLIAPVKIGREAVTGAGSSITGDVPPESLAVERTVQKTIPGWAKKRRPDKS